MILRTAAALMLLWLLVAFPAHAEDNSPTDFSEARLLATRPPGRYLHTRATQPSPDKPLVGAYYWYHFSEKDGRLFVAAGNAEQPFTEHPITTKGVDYRSEAWHYGQLRDMGYAGLNLVLPMYWGNPGEAGHPQSHLRWSFEGIPPMVRALEKLRKQGAAIPKIGCFYDTTTLSANANTAQHTVDLSTPDGRAWFYVSVRDFFSMVPPHLRATVGGKPLLVISFRDTEAVHGTGDPRVLAYLRERFAADFGVEPFIVAQAVWAFPNADATLDGNAMNLSLTTEATNLAPGFDYPPVGPNDSGPYVAAENGAYYRRQWQRLLGADPARRPRFVFIESWNQWVTGTAIAESKEWGRKYLQMTAPYAALWKAGKQWERKPSDKRTASVPVSLHLDPTMKAQGITLAPSVGDGQWKQGTRDRVGFVSTLPGDSGTGEHLYFCVDDGFAYDLPLGAEYELVVEYLDDDDTSFAVEYDASTGPGTFDAAYRPAATIYRRGTGEWKAAVIRLPDARFADRQNSNADFRFSVSVGGASLKVRWVSLRRL